MANEISRRDLFNSSQCHSQRRFLLNRGCQTKSSKSIFLDSRLLESLIASERPGYPIASRHPIGAME